MNLREEFKKETGIDAIYDEVDERSGENYEAVEYSYMEWIEGKLKQRQETRPHETIVICRFMKRMAEKHGVEIDDLNIHSTHGQLHIQKYTPGSLHEFRCLEILDMEGI